MKEVWTIEDYGTGYMMSFGDINIKLFPYSYDQNVLTQLCMDLNSIFKEFRENYE